jgi:stage II sporulation protein D
VRATAGRILTYGGQPAVTYYFSTSGGHTENVEFSFIGALSKPWLVGVPDPYDTRSPYHRWQVSFSGASLGRALGARGAFRRLEVLQRGVSPRVVRARVIGSRGSTTITGPTVRARLGLRDTWFSHVRVSSSSRAPRLARRAGSGRTPSGHALSGEFWPAPRRRMLDVERRGPNGRWLDVGTARTTAGGRYHFEVARAGVYRVRAGAVSGPLVRVR